VILLDNIISREFYNGKLTQAPQAKRWYSEVSPTTLGTFFSGGLLWTYFKRSERGIVIGGTFQGDPIPREDLKRIVEAGLMAPSGKNAQTTGFVIVDDPELVKEIGGMHPGNKALQQARALIACIIDREPEAVYEGMNFQVRIARRQWRICCCP